MSEADFNSDIMIFKALAAALGPPPPCWLSIWLPCITEVGPEPYKPALQEFCNNLVNYFGKPLMQSPLQN